MHECQDDRKGGLSLRGVAVTTETATTAETGKTGKTVRSSLGTVFVGHAKGGQGALQNRQNRQNRQIRHEGYPPLNSTPLSRHPEIQCAGETSQGSNGKPVVLRGIFGSDDPNLAMKQGYLLKAAVLGAGESSSRARSDTTIAAKTITKNTFQKYLS